MAISDWVLWEDASLLVVNKPAGLPTLPDGYDPAAPHLKSVLAPHYGQLWIVHRLDKDTSGVIVLARSATAHRLLNTQFEQRQVIKTYHALALGSPDWLEKDVSLRLRPNGDRRHRTVADARRGKEAATSLRVLEHLGRCTLLEAVPHTGRTHQVRAHLAAVGLPLLADPLYGGQVLLAADLLPGSPSRPILDRPGLHAWALELTHPQSGEQLRLQAGYPPDLEEALAVLRRGG